jgi:hypothetical protein
MSAAVMTQRIAKVLAPSQGPDSRDGNYLAGIVWTLKQQELSPKRPRPGAIAE